MRWVFFLLLLVWVVQTDTITCHYSCNSCASQLYTNCTSCPDNQQLTYILNSTPYNQGPCASITTTNFNSVGIILFAAAILTAVLLFNEEVIYLVLFYQSLGLLYLVEVDWQPALDYTLAGITYLMVFTRISNSYKSDPPPNTNTNLFKGRLFFKQFDLLFNFSTVGIANLILIFVIVFAVVFKTVRKKCVKERSTTVPDWVIDKIVLGCSTGFLFLIQESTAVLFFSIKYGTFSPGAPILMVIYFIALILFTVNQFFYPLSCFRGKFVQCSTIVSKCLTPIFLLFPPGINYLAFLFLIIAWTVDLIAANKNLKQNQFNRLLAFKIVNLVCLCGLTLYYLLEMVKSDESLSRAFSIVGVVLVYISLHLLGLEIVHCLKQKCEGSLDQTLKNINKTSDFSANKEVTMDSLKLDGHEKTEDKIEINFQNATIGHKTRKKEQVYQRENSDNDPKQSKRYQIQHSEEIDLEAQSIPISNFRETSSVSIKPPEKKQQKSVQLVMFSSEKKSDSKSVDLVMFSSDKRSEQKVEENYSNFEHIKSSERSSKEPEKAQQQKIQQNIEMTDSKVPLGETKKKHKKSKRKGNSNQ